MDWATQRTPRFVPILEDTAKTFEYSQLEFHAFAWPNRSNEHIKGKLSAFKREARFAVADLAYTEGTLVWFKTRTV